MVKLGNRIALDASYENGYSKIDVEKYDQESGYFGMDPSFCGRWIKWEAGVPMDMDVLVGSVLAVILPRIYCTKSEAKIAYVFSQQNQ